MEIKKITKDILLSLMINNNEKIIDLSEEKSNINTIIGKYNIENQTENIRMKMMTLHNTQEREIMNGFIVFVKIAKEKVVFITLDVFVEIVSYLLFDLKYSGQFDTQLIKEDIDKLIKWKTDVRSWKDIPSFLLQVSELNPQLALWDIFPKISANEMIVFRTKLFANYSYTLINSVISSCYGVFEPNFKDGMESMFIVSDKIEEIAKLFNKGISTSDLVLFVVILAIAPQMMETVFGSYELYKSTIEFCESIKEELKLSCKLTVSRYCFLRLLEQINLAANKHVKEMSKSGWAKRFTDEIRSLVSMIDNTLRSLDKMEINANANDNDNDNDVDLPFFSSFFKIVFPLDPTQQDNFENTFMVIKNKIMAKDWPIEEKETNNNNNNNKKKMKFSNDKEEDEEEEDEYLKDLDDLIVYVPNNLLFKHCKEEKIIDDVSYTPLVFDDTNMMKMNKMYYMDDICKYGNVLKVLSNYKEEKFNPLDGFHGLIYTMLTQMVLSKDEILFMRFIENISFMIHPQFYAKVKPFIDECESFEKYMNDLGQLYQFLSCCFAEDCDETDIEVRRMAKIAASMFVFVVLENIPLSLNLQLLQKDGKPIFKYEKGNTNIRDVLIEISKMLSEPEPEYVEESMIICEHIFNHFITIDNQQLTKIDSYNETSNSFFQLLQTGTKKLANESKIYKKRFPTSTLTLHPPPAPPQQKNQTCENYLKVLGHFERFTYDIDYRSFELHLQEMQSIHKFHDYETLKQLDFPLFRAYNGAGRTCGETPDSFIILQSEMACVSKCYVNGAKNFKPDSFYGLDNNIITVISLSDPTVIENICHNFRSLFEIHQ